MSSDSFAPYATAATSVLVYKGKGILVKRARDLQSAILDAIEEFELKCSPASVYISAYIGAHGQEVIVSKSAFAFVRDTIPLHVHIKEEDHTRTPSEASRWPPPPTHPYPVDLFGPKSEFTLRKPLKKSKDDSDESRIISTTSQSRMESISDWQRNTSGTPDTAPSVHQAAPHTAFVQSPEEMLPNVNITQSLDVSEQPDSSASPPDDQSVIGNKAAKSWNWFKNAVKAPSLPLVTKQDSPLPPAQPPTPEPRARDVEREVEQMHASAEEKGDPFQQVRPAADQRQSSKSKRSSRRVAQEIKDILKPSQDASTESSNRSGAPRGAPKRQSMHIDHTSSESWGPGGLILDDGVTIHQSPSGRDNPTGHQPWWARPVETFDSTKNRNKLGLKPLKLVKSDTSDVESDAGIRKQTQRPMQKRHGSGSPTPRGIVIGLSSPGSPSSPPARAQAPVAAPAPAQIRVPRKRSKENARPAQAARPLPDDFPESPASNRRFTRPAEQLEAAALAARQAKPGSKSQSRKRSQHDIIPVVPVAKNKPARPGLQSHTGNTAISPAPPTRARRESIVSQEDFPTTPESSDHEGQSAAMKRLRQKQRKKSTIDIRGAVPVAQPEQPQVVRNRPVRTIINSQTAIAAASPPAPEVPIAPLAKPLQAPAGGAGTFAAALTAARRQMTGRDTNDVSPAEPSRPAFTQARSRQAKQRSSLSSMKDFVPARLLAVIAEEDHSSAAPSELSNSQSSSLLQAPPSVARSGSVQSRDSYAAGNADTIYLDRIVLGPMDITSPSKRGAQLVMKALPATSEITVEWKQEKKVVLNLAFDALSAVQLPGPDCDYVFILLKIRRGEVKEVLLELSHENLIHFQRFLLILIAGAGAEIDHLGAAAYEKIVDVNGW